MECSICQIFGEELPVFACDGHKVLLCKTCSNFTASETKVMHLKERTMKFDCKDCLSSSTVKLLLWTVNDKDMLMHSKNKITELLEKHVETYKLTESDLKNKVVYLQAQINRSVFYDRYKWQSH